MRTPYLLTHARPSTGSLVTRVVFARDLDHAAEIGRKPRYARDGLGRPGYVLRNAEPCSLVNVELHFERLRAMSIAEGNHAMAAMCVDRLERWRAWYVAKLA
jgi:hypothetical protein